MTSSACTPNKWNKIILIRPVLVMARHVSFLSHEGDVNCRWQTMCPRWKVRTAEASSSQASYNTDHKGMQEGLKDSNSRAVPVLGDTTTKTSCIETRVRLLSRPTSNFLCNYLIIIIYSVKGQTQQTSCIQKALQ